MTVLIIEYVLKKNGFRELEVKPYADLYSMPQTLLHIAAGPTS